MCKQVRVHPDPHSFGPSVNMCTIYFLQIFVLVFIENVRALASNSKRMAIEYRGVDVRACQQKSGWFGSQTLEGVTGS